MFEVSEADLGIFKISTRMVVEELLVRGCRVFSFYSASAMLEVIVPQNPTPMRLFSVVNEEMSFISGRSIVSNKQITNSLLASKGFHVPDEYFVKLSELENSIEAIQSFITKHGQVVFKPIDGSHGNGVHIGVKTIDQIRTYAKEVEIISQSKSFILQQQLSGCDLRIVCIDNKYASAITRVPAFVIGDGKHTIDELIDLENDNENRGEDYSVQFNKINKVYVEEYLSIERLNEVPAEGEHVQVVGISNVGVGGIRVNVDNDVPQFLREIAENISEELRLPICGVDFFINKLPNTLDTEDDLHPVIIEVNNCPGLTMYDDFNSPQQKALVAKLVDSHLDAHNRRYPVNS